MALKGAVNNVERVPVNQGIHQYGGKIFDASEYEHIKCLTKAKKTRYLFNFTLLRQELSKEIPEWHPFKLKNNTPLLKWIHDGTHYSRLRNRSTQMTQVTKKPYPVKSADLDKSRSPFCDLEIYQVAWYVSYQFLCRKNVGDLDKSRSPTGDLDLSRSEGYFFSRPKSFRSTQF